MLTHLGDCPSCNGYHDRIDAVATPGSDWLIAKCPANGGLLCLVPGEPAVLVTGDLPAEPNPEFITGDAPAATAADDDDPAE